MIKAVVVGINAYQNYPNQSLAGCINDADDVLAYLTTAMKVDPRDVTPLYDDRATKEEIVRALRDMIASSSAGDHLLFHYSGHGAQIEADSVSEPDGLDEVLCPHDFTFTDRTTALTDDEIDGLFQSLPPQVAMTIVVDACHSGDIKKLIAAKPTSMPRFLRPPTDIAWRLANKRVKPRSRARAFVEGVAVSACQSSETAADTSFNARPNGAFTYYWLQALNATPKATLEALVATTSQNIVTYGMHPQLDGSDDLRGAAFLDEHVLAARSKALMTGGRRTIAPSARSIVVFDDKWYATAFGVPVSLGLAISRTGSVFNFEVTPGVAGAVTRFTFPVDGNVSLPIPVPLIGQIVVDVGNWSLSMTSLSFTLSVRVQPSLGFLPPVTIVTQHITIPLALEQRALDVPTTASELQAMLALLRGGQLPAAPAPSRDITLQDNTPINNAAYGTLSWGPNWKEDHPVTGQRLMHNQVRYGEPTFFGQQGAGQVYFNRWLSDDPTDASFECHIGNSFWGGWGSCQWSVQAVYANVDLPRALPRRPTAPTEPPAAERPHASSTNGAGSNGHSHRGEPVVLSDAER